MSPRQKKPVVARPQIATRVAAGIRRRLMVLAGRHGTTLGTYVSEVMTSHATGRSSCPGCRAHPELRCGACSFGYATSERIDG